jgi:predicted CoA-binding protein
MSLERGSPSDPGKQSEVPTSDRIAEILTRSKTIAIVGLSSRRLRPSHGVADYLKSQGYRIFPVSPNETEVLGEKKATRSLKTFLEAWTSWTYFAALNMYPR